MVITLLSFHQVGNVLLPKCCHHCHGHLPPKWQGLFLSCSCPVYILWGHYLPHQCFYLYVYAYVAILQLDISVRWHFHSIVFMYVLSWYIRKILLCMKISLTKHNICQYLQSQPTHNLWTILVFKTSCHLIKFGNFVLVVIEDIDRYY